MKILRSIAATCLVAILAISISSCSKSEVYNAPDVVTDSAMVQKITIQNMQFQPAIVSVMIGTKITWTNLDAEAHAVTSDDGTSFNSGNIPAGGSFSFTATSNGTFTYHCNLHPAMTGTIYVLTR